jgi:UDP-N-acetylglucosamine 4-epimerase
VDCADREPRFEDFRKGDARHSLADVTAIREALGWSPVLSLEDGLAITLDAFLADTPSRTKERR